MSDWFETMEARFWLQPDNVGAGEARFIMKALHLCSGDAVLDAPCGAGRVSFHLAEAGCTVTGIDLRGSFIRRARQRFRTADLHGRFQVLDLRDLKSESQYDAIFNWGGSFGYSSETENAQLLASYARALRPGGQLIVDQPNREHILRHFRSVMRSDSTTFHSRWDARAERVITRRLDAAVKNQLNLSSVRLYTPAQMRALFRRSGLIVEAVHKSLVFEAYGKAVPRMVTVGRKPKA